MEVTSKRALIESICIVLFTWAFAWNFYHVSPNPEMKNFLVTLDKIQVKMESFEPPPNYSKVVGLCLFLVRFYGLILIPCILIDFICGNRATDDEQTKTKTK